MVKNKEYIYIDLLARSFLNLRIDLDEMCEKAVNEKERAFAMGRLAGIDMAISLLEAYQSEMINQELDSSPPPHLPIKYIPKS